jgi:hypothetical protein
VIGGGENDSYFDKMFYKYRFIYIYKALKLYYYQYLIKKKLLNDITFRITDIFISVVFFSVVYRDFLVRFLVDQLISTIALEIYIYYASKYYLKFNEYVVYALIMVPYSCIC